MSMSKEDPMLSSMNNTMVDLPSPSNMNYLWNFGSLLGFCLVMQIMTGIFLAMHYCADFSLAYLSMMHMSSNVNYGFLLKYLHTNVASVFFLCVYMHMASGLYYGSYLKMHLWYSGMIMYMIMMLTAFMGYVLPWGQMSFWGATVMTNFLSAMPYVGNDVVQWVWGGFSVSNATLKSFLSLHYLFPFMLIGLIIIHLILLHNIQSNNPLGMNSNCDKMPFHIYYTTKDFYGFILVGFLMFYLMFYMPNFLGDVENFMNANPLITPTHIMPEWYFLFAYAMLSAMPNKLGGVMALMISMLILLMMPFIHTSKLKSLNFSPLGKLFYWIFMVNFIFLTWMGSKSVEEPFIFLGQMSSTLYFSYFLILLPFSGYTENMLTFEN